ncbi:tectonic-1 isoform X1 [Channa argus]|uniref:tectonic-1 isoform X1 n=1 Tax=Channa argus TaxID=215402 RepID=UPI0035202350
MAASTAQLWLFLYILSIFLACAVISSSANVTSYQTNKTGFIDHSITYNNDGSYTTEPTESGVITQTPRAAEESLPPAPPAEPLPVSGRLLTPLAKVDSLCPCDEHTGVCDINCCCDRECGEEVALFTDCSVPTVSGDKQLCSRDVASYTLESTAGGYSVLKSSFLKETSYDIFCIQSKNRVDISSHPSPALPTDSNFESLFKQFTTFSFDSKTNNGQVSSAGLQASSGYEYGDVMVTAGEHGQKRVFWLPAPGVTADCVDTSPAAFLKDQSSQCSRRLVLDQSCSALPALNMDTYSNIQLFAGKNADAAVLPVEIALLTLQSIDGTQTELKIGGGEIFSPVLLNPDLCANVVLKVDYVMKYNPAGEIVNVTVSMVLGFVHGATQFLKQEFQIAFVQDGVEGTVHYSGNPGYVVGLPLVSGTRTADGIVRSINPRDTLSLLQSGENQDCLHGPHERSPVLFGLDSVSGCTLRLEDAENCSIVSQVLLDVLRGPNYPQYVASFGNSPLGSPLDWLQIQNTFIPKAGHSCAIPLSLHLEIMWTQYGSLMNPQPQIVSINEIVQTNTTSLSLLSGGSSFLSIRSSVAFIAASAPALPGFRATPTINAKLPFDFFFPFV